MVVRAKRSITFKSSVVFVVEWYRRMFLVAQLTTPTECIVHTGSLNLANVRERLLEKITASAA